MTQLVSDTAQTSSSLSAFGPARATLQGAPLPRMNCAKWMRIVRGYEERGNINTPLELATQNQVDRFSIAIDVIDRVPRLKVAGAHAKEYFRNQQIECRSYAYANGVDKPEIVHWKWSY